MSKDAKRTGLVLSRRQGEEIKIGHDIVLRVVRIRGERVQILIDAPRDVPVHRGEVYQRLKGEQGSA